MDIYQIYCIHYLPWYYRIQYIRSKFLYKLLIYIFYKEILYQLNHYSNIEKMIVDYSKFILYTKSSLIFDNIKVYSSFENNDFDIKSITAVLKLSNLYQLMIVILPNKPSQFYRISKGVSTLLDKSAIDSLQKSDIVRDRIITILSNNIMKILKEELR